MFRHMPALYPGPRGGRDSMRRAGAPGRL